MMTIPYTVFSADAVKVPRTVDVDGAKETVMVDGLSVQLTSEGQGTIVLSLTKGQAAAFQFVAGETINVSFGG